MRSNDEIISLIQENIDEKGLSMSELARRVGIAKSSALLRGNSLVLLKYLDMVDFARALNITPEYLLGIQKESNVDQAEIISIYNKLEQPRQEKVLSYAKDQLEAC